MLSIDIRGVFFFVIFTNRIKDTITLINIAISLRQKERNSSKEKDRIIMMVGVDSFPSLI
jgi:hypothetical protein